MAQDRQPTPAQLLLLGWDKALLLLSAGQCCV
jgi:hypothetical protein